MRHTLFLIFLFHLLLCTPGTTWSHPLAPALLQLDQQDGQQWQVTWQLPASPGTRQLEPVLPAHCSAQTVPSWRHKGNAVITEWEVICGPSLAGSTFGIQGLTDYPGGTLIRLQFSDGRRHQQLLQGDSQWQVPGRPNTWQLSASFIGQGIEHLLSGVDHLMFVAVLTLLLGWGKNLLWTVTLFTLGHSITLALASFGWLTISQAWLDPLIALSIVVACAQLLRDGIARYNRTWWPAIAFGLLHGLGFAQALQTAGVSHSELPLALASFNAGIELGQIIVITMIVMSWRVLGNLELPATPWLQMLPAWTAGLIAAVWFWRPLISAMTAPYY